MKKVHVFFVLLIVMSVCMSCSQDVSKSMLREITEVNGLRVVLREGVPEDAMRLGVEDMSTMLANYSIGRSAGDDGNAGAITLEELYTASETRLKDYPFSQTFAAVSESDGIGETEDDLEQECIQLTDAQLQIIMADFPDLKTEQDVYDNLESIMGIYDRQGAYEVVDEVLNPSPMRANAVSRDIYSSTTDSSGVTTYRFFDKVQVNSSELRVLLCYPFQIPGYVCATYDAKHLERSYYHCAQNGGDDQRDAMRHSLWNALIAQQCIFMSRNARINFAERITNAHEAGTKNGDSDRISSAMDLHNNRIGRDLYMNNSYGLWKFVHNPTMDTLARKAYQMSQTELVVVDTKDADTAIKEIDDSKSKNKLVALKLSTAEQIAANGDYYGY